jgi:hypothetical protein
LAALAASVLPVRALAGPYNTGVSNLPPT